MNPKSQIPNSKFLWASVLLVAAAASSATAADDTAKWPIVFEDNFENGADRWAPSNPTAWKIIDTPKGKVFSQFQNIILKTPHRSPYNFALVKDLYMGDFVIDALCLSTKADYPHRDMCVFWGYQDLGHMYYVHFGKRTDDHANQIFIVNGADRQKISTKTTPGTNWDEKWHNVRVIRRVGDGTTEVYFDDMQTPVMTATDKTFTWGQVGVGCFDDTGDWDDIVVRGAKVEKGEVGK